VYRIRKLKIVSRPSRRGGGRKTVEPIKKMFYNPYNFNGSAWCVFHFLFGKD
jgi:hypothetical protein